MSGSASTFSRVTTVFTYAWKPGAARAFVIAVQTCSKLPTRPATASWISARGPWSEKRASSRKGMARSAKSRRAIIVPMVPIDVRMPSFLASASTSTNCG